MVRARKISSRQFVRRASVCSTDGEVLCINVGQHFRDSSELMFKSFTVLSSFKSRFNVVSFIFLDSIFFFFIAVTLNCWFARLQSSRSVFYTVRSYSPPEIRESVVDLQPILQCAIFCTRFRRWNSRETLCRWKHQFFFGVKTYSSYATIVVTSLALPPLLRVVLSSTTGRYSVIMPESTFSTEVLVSIHLHKITSEVGLSLFLHIFSSASSFPPLD